jgi:dienelactone hydrolase
VNEIIVTFGTDQHLVGTLVLPALMGPVGFLLLNAGVIHRIGPHRSNVKLARGLAAKGIVSLRFDLSGQGDSRIPRDAAAYERQAVKDIRAAIDHLQRLTGLQHVIIAGICSGADHGLAVAEEDPRVVGLWMMDGYTYTSAKTAAHYYLLRLQRLRRDGAFAASLLAWLGRRLRALPERLVRRWVRGGGDAAAAETAAYARALPSRDAYAATMQSLVDRGVDIFVMYSGSSLERYSYARQYRDTFAGHGFVDTVRCDFAPQIDHTVTLLAAQRQLVATVCEWAQHVTPPVRAGMNVGDTIGAVATV